MQVETHKYNGNPLQLNCKNAPSTIQLPSGSLLIPHLYKQLKQSSGPHRSVRQRWTTEQKHSTQLWKTMPSQMRIVMLKQSPIPIRIAYIQKLNKELSIYEKLMAYCMIDQPLSYKINHMFIVFIYSNYWFQNDIKNVFEIFLHPKKCSSWGKTLYHSFLSKNKYLLHDQIC